MISSPNSKFFPSLNSELFSPSPKRYPDFQWTFSTLGCPELDLDAICRLARAFDLEHIELRAAESTVDLPALFRKRFGRPASLARFLDDQGVGICCLDTSLSLIGNDGESRRAFLKFLPWAEAIGTRMLRIFDGGTAEDGLDDAALAQAEDTMEWWRREKEQSGWLAEVVVEIHSALVHHRAIRRINQSIPHLNFIWDTHHTWAKGGDSIETSWKFLGSAVVNVHIKDSISQPSARHPYTYVNLGDGRFPLEDTLELLQNKGYRGFVSIEWEKMWHPYLPEINVALRRGRELGWF